MGGETISGQLERPKPKRSLAWLLLALPVGLFVYLWMRPVMRLRADPPAEFLEMPREWDAKRRASEKRLALAYWEVAVRFVQWRYPYGEALPASLPTEFNLAGTGLARNGLAVSAATNARYWHRLRQVWDLPQSWQQSYEWNTGWWRGALYSFQQSVLRLVNGITRQFKT